MIKAAVDNFSRQQILDVLNEICLIAFQDNTMLVEKIDTATGKPPLLTTVDGTFHYNCPSDCRETAAIFTETVQNYSVLKQGGFNPEYVWRDKMYIRMPVKQISATRGALATITFNTNPGTTTDRYFHHYFIRHTPITDERIELPFPEELHYIIRTGVIQMLKGEAYSAGLGDIDPIQKIVSLIRSKINKGANARLYRTPVPTEYRDDDFAGSYY